MTRTDSISPNPPQGSAWVAVPSNLTFGMRIALEEAMIRHDKDLDRVWREVLDYAPTAPAHGAGGRPLKEDVAPHVWRFRSPTARGWSQWQLGPVPDDLGAWLQQHEIQEVTSITALLARIEKIGRA